MIKKIILIIISCALFLGWFHTIHKVNELYLCNGKDYVEISFSGIDTITKCHIEVSDIFYSDSVYCNYGDDSIRLVVLPSATLATIIETLYIPIITCCYGTEEYKILLEKIEKENKND